MDLFAFDDLYVRRLKEHDRETEAHFAQYFRPILFAKLGKSVPAQDIDDVIHEVFVRVLSRLDDVRDGHKFGAFVLGFCNNIVLERYRKNSRTEPLIEVHEQIVDQKSDAERDFFSEEAAAAVRVVLSEMRPRDASILRAVLADEPRKEICQRLGVSAEYLGVVLHRAKERFKVAYGRRKK
jgi:RNA polymerase sigma-70 factor, ECF subfamily